MTSHLDNIFSMAESMGDRLDEFEIKTLVLGLRYSGILLNNGVLGLSYTLTNHYKDFEGFHKLFKNGKPSTKSLSDLFAYSNSEYSVLRTISVAALNAFSQTQIIFDHSEQKDIKTLINPSPERTIGMVGNIRPIVSYILKKGAKVKILDEFMPKNKKHGIEYVDTVKDLENVDGIIVSGSALVFENFDQIIDILPTINGFKGLTGPSAQLIPELAFNLGFSAVGSVQILDPNAVLDIIKQGGGFREFKGYTSKYLFSNA
ncbi:MAG: Rossmann-like domain-containing protein [Candidatus Hodarchaeales archaeon]